MNSKIFEFEYQGRIYRVVRLKFNESQIGYIGFSEEHYNVLQVKLTNWLSILRHGSLWKDVEREKIPGHALISLGCLGDTGGWSSALLQKCQSTMGMKHP